MRIMGWSLFEPYPTLRTVMVTTKTDKTFRGVLWQRRRGYLVLRQVELLKLRGETVLMPGELLIESANVDFVQVVS